MGIGMQKDLSQKQTLNLEFNSVKVKIEKKQFNELRINQFMKQIIHQPQKPEPFIQIQPIAQDDDYSLHVIIKTYDALLYQANFLAEQQKDLGNNSFFNNRSSSEHQKVTQKTETRSFSQSTKETSKDIKGILKQKQNVQFRKKQNNIQTVKFNMQQQSHYY